MRPKRTREEWLTIARVARGVAHLFLEGSSDARILAHACGYPQNVDFRTADEVDDDVPDSHPLWGGNKLRLMHLVSAASIRDIRNISCLVDKDFSIFVSATCRSERLLFTPHANFPASTLTYEWINGLLLKAYGFPLNNETWKFMCTALRLAFVSRFISAVSGAPKSAPDIVDYVKKTDSSFSLSEASYMKSYFANDQESINLVKVIIEEIETIDRYDIRLLCNSSDLFSMIYIMLRKSGRISGSTPRDAIRQAYLGAMDEKALVGEGFDAVRAWIASF